MKKLNILTLVFVNSVWLSSIVYADNKIGERPDLLFREDIVESPADFKMSQKHIAHPDLTLHLYGIGKSQLKKSHHPELLNDPYYIWSGLAQGNWLVMLEYKREFDLTGLAKVRWRARQSGFRQLHLVIELASGVMLVSDVSDGPSKDWRIKEFNIQDITWYELDSQIISEMDKVENVDLSKVKGVGFTDLMPGGTSWAASRLDWIEVYAK